MISKVRTLIKEAVNRFYTIHHDSQKFEDELVTEVNDARVLAFVNMKRQVVDALDYRLSRLNESVEVLKRNDKSLVSVIDDMESRIDELETFRHYVKGMVVKADE